MFTHNECFCEIQYCIQAKINNEIFKIFFNELPINPGTCVLKSVRKLHKIFALIYQSLIANVKRVRDSFIFVLRLCSDFQTVSIFFYSFTKIYFRTQMRFKTRSNSIEEEKDFKLFIISLNLYIPLIFVIDFPLICHIFQSTQWKFRICKISITINKHKLFGFKWQYRTGHWTLETVQSKLYR